MNILVTGGSGYIGTTLAPLLLKEQHKVCVLDNLYYQQIPPEIHSENYRFINDDIRNSSISSHLEDIDVIIHLAALVGAPICKKHPIEAESINIQGTKNLLDHKKEEQCIIFASTGSTYGSIKGDCTENITQNPLSLYAETKVQGEKLVQTSTNYIIYRLATVYGVSPRHRLDLLPNNFTYQAIKQGNLTVYEKDAMRSFIHIKDAAAAFLHAIKNIETMKNQTYNCGSEENNLTKEGLATLIQKIIDFKITYREFDSDPDKRNYHVSYKKIKTTGYNTNVSMDQGIKELVNYYKTNTHHQINTTRAS